ncbi:MAG: hypothetical protein U0805_16265 [Pirellulales bacterium]
MKRLSNDRSQTPYISGVRPMSPEYFVVLRCSANWIPNVQPTLLSKYIRVEAATTSGFSVVARE